MQEILKKFTGLNETRDVLLDVLLLRIKATISHTDAHLIYLRF